MRPSRILLLGLLAAVLGFTIFGIMVWRSVTVEETPVDEARVRFETVLAALGEAEPLLVVGADGQLERGPDVAGSGIAPSTFRVLAWRAEERRLATAEMPFWFFRLKQGAAQLALRGTGFDLQRLSVTADDLAAHGPGLLLDETAADGDRLLIWLE